MRVRGTPQAFASAPAIVQRQQKLFPENFTAMHAESFFQFGVVLMMEHESMLPPLR